MFISELVDFTAPAFQPGRPFSLHDVAPIAIDGGPSTLQLAMAAAVTLGAFTLLRRQPRSAVAVRAKRKSKAPKRRKQYRRAA